ncbi:MAG TPA: competence protein ComK [Bacilli bacterium]|nr:competence protein ComK [Bacilli bacterium]
MNNYEINEETLIIMPISDKKSKVIEKSDEHIIDLTPNKIMENSCSYFGSSLMGRQNGSKYILGSNYKIPIVVEESKDIIFFPTTSPSLDNCHWIAVNNIKDIIKKERKTIIVFDNDQEIVIDIPYLSIQNQILRATRLNAILKKRKY